MKINAQEQSIEASGLGQTTNFGIKNSAAAFQLLSSGLYTNKIRAVLREIGCNAVDAHALNGQQATPIEVKLPNRLDNQFYIRDFGPGLSHDQIMHLYSTYFDSTKQASDDFIGGFGVGSKSPFAYTDSFTVVSRQNGVERVYAAFVNDEGMPTIATMNEATPTTEANGLMVGFPVRPEDFYTFESEARDVYAAFKVKPNVLGVSMQLSAYASKPVVEGVATLSGENHRRGELQLNMGGVRYPLNAFTEKLRNTSVELSTKAQWLYQQSVEVDVPIGSVSVAASREALQYDKKTMANIPGIIDAAAQRCLDHLQSTLHSVPKTLSPVDRAKKLQELLRAKGNLAWRRLPAKIISSLFPDQTDLMVCQMALTEQYTVDMTKYPALHVWRMQGSVHEKLHEHGVKGNKMDDFEGRKKMLTSLRRNWSSLTSTDQALDLLFSHTTHSLVTHRNGPAKAIDHNELQFSLEKKMQVLETTTPIALESLLANHQAQPSADYYDRHSKKYVLSPVQHYVDGKAVPLTAQQLQEFETQKKAFYSQYGVEATPLAGLSVVTAPPKVKATPAVWTIPLTVQVHTELKKTLRGIPSSEVGIAHSVPSSEPMAYVLYDRKASQERLQMGSLSSTDLIVQSNKHSGYLSHSEALEKHNIPVRNTQLVDKKDFPAFKALYPNAMPLSSYINNLKQDPMFLAEAVAWSKNRPKLVHVDHAANQWIDLAAKTKNLSPQSPLAQLVKEWSLYATSGNDKYGEDCRARSFYNCILQEQYPENALLNTNDDVRKLNTLYPYIRHFNYSTPDELKAEYITDVNTKNGWAPLDPFAPQTVTPNPY